MRKPLTCRSCPARIKDALERRAWHEFAPGWQTWPVVRRALALMVKLAFRRFGIAHAVELAEACPGCWDGSPHEAVMRLARVKV